MKNFFIISIVGILTGLVNGLLGIGGGTILIPAMVFMLKEKQHVAHGTSLAVILPTAFVSALIYKYNQNLDLNLSFKVALGAMLGGYLGAKLMNLLSPPSLKKIFGLFMMIAGLRMVL